MSDLQERPDLSRRRKPQPASDERVDPVDYRQPAAPSPAATPVAPILPTPSADPTPAPVAPAQRGRPRREVTVPFSTRLSPDVLDLIDAAVTAGGNGTTIRGVVETAIREKYGNN
jgi:hypothetical protein